MRTFLNRLWHKRKVLLLYGVLLFGGWFLGDVLKDWTVPEMRPLNEPMIHRLVMTAFVAFILLAAIPFIPGAEIGFALLLIFGGQVAPLVYLGMVGALVVSYAIARIVPSNAIGRALRWLGSEKASEFVIKLDTTPQSDRLAVLSSFMPSAVGAKLLNHRYVLLAVALNTPGNSLVGGGGGLAFIAGASRLFDLWPFLLVVVCAVAPVPLFFLLT